MRGVVASITSCIGGKDERYAVKIQPMNQEVYYVYKTMGEFEALWAKLEALAAEAKLKQQLFEGDDSSSQDVGVLAKWLMSFIDHFAFRSTIEQLREQGRETITPLNTLLQAVVRRASALYVDSSILRCGCCHVGRQLALLTRNFTEFAQHDTRAQASLAAFGSPRSDSGAGAYRKRALGELRPEEDELHTLKRRAMPMFPVRPCEGASSSATKSRKLSSVDSAEFLIPHIKKVRLDAPSLPGRVVSALPGRRRVFAEVDMTVL
jgi:hypothetical protein